MDWGAFTETAEHQTTAHVKLVGKVQIAIFVFRSQDVSMALVRMPLNATVTRDGKELTATSLAAPTAPMANVSHLTNVFAIMAGLVKTVMSVSPWLAVSTDTAWIILTPVSARVDGKDTFVTSLTAIWIAITDSVMPQVLPILPTSVSVTLDGEVKHVTYAVHTGDVQIRAMMLATTPMNASVSRLRMTQIICATTQF